MVMLTFDQAIFSLKERDDFKVIEKTISEFIDTHVLDLSDIKNAENPQLLAYLAGGISAMKTLQNLIEEGKHGRTGQGANQE